MTDKTCFDATKFYDKLCDTPRIYVVQRNQTDSQALYQNQTESFHNELNGGWSKPLTQYNPNKYELEKLPIFRDPAVSPFEVDPDDTPELNSSHQINKSKVQEFLNIRPTPQIEGILSLKNVTKPETKFPFEVSLPTKDIDVKSLITIELKYFKIADLQPGEKTAGFVQIYDSQTCHAVSEPVYFTSDDGNNIKLTQTEQRVIYVPIRNLQLKLSLACFLSRKPEDSPLYHLYACNICQLFDEDSNLSTDIKFHQNWYHISNCKDVPSMFTLNETIEDNIVKVDSKFEVLQIRDMNQIKNMRFTYSWKGKSSLCYSVLPLYPIPDVPSPLGSIFNFHFTLNNPPSNSDLYLKAIAINEGGDINIKDVESKYKKLAIFPLENCELKDTFITSASPSSNEYATPECIRIYVTNEVTEDTIIVVYLMSRQNKKGKVKEEIYKVGVIPLKNEDANLQITQRIPLFDLKGFPKKYLSQPKKMNKTFLQYTLSLPPVFFPTPFCKQLFASDSYIPELPPDLNMFLSSAIIPVFAKLISIRSNQTLDRLLAFLDAFKDTIQPASPIPLSTTSPNKKEKAKDKKERAKEFTNYFLSSSLSLVFNGTIDSRKYRELLTYFLYNNFDSSDCRPDFFCETLHDHIQENVLCITSIREKYENTRGVMHEINNGKIDLNSNQLITAGSSAETKKEIKSFFEAKRLKKANLQMQKEVVNDLKKARDSLNLIVDHIDILLDIVAVSLSRYIKQNKKTFKEDFIPRPQPIVAFFKDFGNFLMQLDFIETTESLIIKIARRFAKVLYLVQTYFSSKELSEIVFQIFYDTSLYVDEQDRVAQLSLKIQLYVMQSLIYTPNLFVAASSTTQELGIKRPFSPFNRVFGQIFKMANNIFLYDWREQDTEDLMYLFCGNLSVLTSQLEEGIYDNQVRAHVCYFLLPMVLNISSYYDKLVEISGLQASIIPFILFVLNNCDNNYLFRYFHNLSTINQMNFISFLKTIATVSINTETIGKYGYIKQITQRLLNILLVFVDRLGVSMEQTIDLVKLLLFDNEFQTPINYPNFYNFLSQLMIKQKCNNTLIHILLDNIKAKYHSLRCLCASLLSWQINADYKRNNDIFQSSINMLDSLTAILLQGNPDDIQTYLSLISLISDLAPDYGDSKFTKMVTERMKTAKVMADVIEEQKRSVLPPEILCKQTMKIADEYKLLPSMRIKWLQRILSINTDDGNYVSAFITQMHIVALIAAIYDHKRRIDLKNAGMSSLVTARKDKHLSLDGSENSEDSDSSEALPDPPFHLMIVRPIENAYPRCDYVHSQPYLDFEYLPEAATETLINFEGFQRGAWELLQTYDFNMLQKEIDIAFEIGTKAELFYSLRPLASLLLRIFYISRNYEGLARASDLLQKALLRISYESCALIHDVNLQFYLVEMITDNGEHQKQVYCVKLGERSARADYESQTQVQIQNQTQASTTSSPPPSNSSFTSFNPPNSKVKPITVETNPDQTSFVIGSNVNEFDKKFVKLIYSEERFGDRKLKICTQHDPQECNDKDNICVVRLEPTGNIPIDDEDPHCWSTFQTRITKKLIQKAQGDTLHLIQIETRDPLPHYKMTVDVKDFKIVEKPIVDVVKEIALYSAAVLDVISENLESYFEYEDAETWNISSDECYTYEFVDKLHILQSVLGMNERVGECDDDASILGLLNALRAKQMTEAGKIVQEVIQPSLKRALMIFQRGKKELTTMENYIVNVRKTLTVANEFLASFDAERIDEEDCYMSKTNSVWQKFKFEKEFDY